MLIGAVEGREESVLMLTSFISGEPGPQLSQLPASVVELRLPYALHEVQWGLL